MVGTSIRCPKRRRLRFGTGSGYGEQLGYGVPGSLEVAVSQMLPVATTVMGPSGGVGLVCRYLGLPTCSGVWVAEGSLSDGNECCVRLTKTPK